MDLPLLKNDITTSGNHHNYRFVISYYGITKKSGCW